VIEIGLTGGIGSGKSTVGEALVRRGAVLLDADRIVRELQQPHTPVFEAMVERFGPSIVADDGTLDRGAVAAIVFADEDELKALNDIVHPAVAAEMSHRRQALLGTDCIVVSDIPLLVLPDGAPLDERYAHLSGVIVVDADPDTAVERLVAQRGFDPEDARNRIARQASREQRLAVADVVIDNSGSLEDLESQLDAAWEWARQLAAMAASGDTPASGDTSASGDTAGKA